MNKPFMVIDVETHDPNLKDMGSGAQRKDGHVLGVAVYAPHRKVHDYIGLRHKDTVADYTRNWHRLRELFSDPCDKVFHNAVYDLDWLVNAENFVINGRWEDTVSREVLLDAYQYSYSLENICARYGIRGKDESVLQRLCEQRGLKGKVQNHLAEFASYEVAPYAKQDVKATGDLYEAQQPRLEAEGLTGVNHLECRLLPLLIRMKKRGVRVDEQKRQEVSRVLHSELRAGYAGLERDFGFVPNFNRAADMVRLWKQCGIPLTLTEKGNPSFDVFVLETTDHPVAKTVLELKHTKTVLNNFVDGSLKNFQVDGRIHTTFYPMKSDEGGTITGRLSSRAPNFQQIPSKDETGGPMIRQILIPDDGYFWAAPDFAQIEYRLYVFFASGPGAEEARAQFARTPALSYHKKVQAMLADSSGDDWWMTKDGYSYVKRFNFGMIYGMGPKGFSKKFYQPLDWCKQMYNTYYDAIPFVRPTNQAIMNTALKRGYVRTVLGRKCRLSDEMRERREQYKLVNYLVQGSAADVNKKAMVDFYEAGLDDVIPMLLTVHDEDPVQVPYTKEGIEALDEMNDIMCNAVKLEVPMMTDMETGPNWGQVSTAHYAEVRKEILE